MLEREGDLLPDDPETLARRREASREASEGEERDMRASAQMTDAGADARAERGRWRDEKPITLHTISPEEALKYVSRVHHKEEVEAAEAAAELARQEAEQQSLREEEEKSLRGCLSFRRGRVVPRRHRGRVRRHRRRTRRAAQLERRRRTRRRRPRREEEEKRG